MITAAILICLAPVPSDGDTLRCGLSSTTVRLFGLNANETGTVGAYEAKVALATEAQGGLICEPRGTNYSRIVAICFNHKGEDVGRKLLNAGHVKEVCAYSRNYYGTCP